MRYKTWMNYSTHHYNVPEHHHHHRYQQLYQDTMELLLCGPLMVQRFDDKIFRTVLPHWVVQKIEPKFLIFALISQIHSRQILNSSFFLLSMQLLFKKNCLCPITNRRHHPLDMANILVCSWILGSIQINGINKVTLLINWKVLFMKRHTQKE